jgi:phenylalanyl-tRNA synthetase beta chain
MKVSLALLSKFIELPSQETKILRPLLDEIGEVKDVQFDTKTKDKIFNVETLANRADHVSILGIARELSAKLLTQIKLPAIASNLIEHKTSIPLRVLSENCTHYSMLELTGSSSMSLLSEVLHSSLSDQETEKKHPIVTLVNYLQTELGQPMHAFDKDTIEGEIIVKDLEKEQEFLALDGKVYQLPKGALVIADKKKILAAAGIIGGESSKTTLETERIIIECAAFLPASIRKTKRAIGISTEASQIYERGSDYAMVDFAIKRLLYLLQGASVTAGEKSLCIPVGFTAYTEASPPKRRTITVRYNEIKRHVNLPRLADIEITTRLKYLGFSQDASSNEKQLVVNVPSWRMYDVFDEADVIEEFVKSFGLNRVKLTLPLVDVSIPDVDFEEDFKEKISSPLLGNGFHEVITKAFYASDKVALLDKLSKPLGDAAHIKIRNAVEKDNSAMKITNLIPMLEIADRNMRYEVSTVKIFETTRLFLKKGAEYVINTKSRYEYEWDALCILQAGSWNRHEYGKDMSIEKKALLFKGILEEILETFGLTLSLSTSSSIPLLYPRAQSIIKLGALNGGFIGLVHPEILNAYEIRGDVLYAEINSKLLFDSRMVLPIREPWNFPSIKRDITLKVKLENESGSVLKNIDSMNISELQSIATVDSFRKEDEPIKRITYRLNFQLKERSLSNEEVENRVQQILKDMKDKFGIELA